MRGDAARRGVSTGNQAFNEQTLAHNAMWKRKLSFKVGIRRPAFANDSRHRFTIGLIVATPVSPQTRPRFRGHESPSRGDINCIIFNRLCLVLRLLFFLRAHWRLIMETVLQGLVIIGGLTFSLATSLLIEELIFGQIVRVAFARRAESSKPFSEHAQKN